MTYLGETLRKARESKGLTTSQLAQKTHIIVQIIEELEKESFKRIAAPIYGRGFIRQICEHLDLDPKPLVAEFMDIYTGRKTRDVLDPFQPKSTSKAEEPPPPKIASAEPTPAEPLASEPTPEEPPASESTPEEPLASEPTPADILANEPTEVLAAPPEKPDVPPEPTVAAEVRGLDLFEQSPVDTSSPVDSKTQEDEIDVRPPKRPQDIFSSAYADPSPVKPKGPTPTQKLRTNLLLISHNMIGHVRQIPRSTLRIALLVCTSLLVLALLIWGGYELYKATATPGGSAPSEVLPTRNVPPAKPNAAKPSADPVTKLRSTGQKIPPLYID